MKLSKAKLQKLEKKIKSRYVKDDSKLVIPDNWVDFARMVKIRSGGDVRAFNPYEYQRKLVDLMLERSVIVIKSRQTGISETITCFMLWRACLNPGYLGLVFSKTQTDSSLLARRMKRMIASLGLKTTTENLSDIEIEGHGRILFRNSKPDSARGIESVVDCFFDEYAFLETAKEVYDALAPAQQMVGDKARVFIVSTPNGKIGHYWNIASSGNGDKDIESICNRISKENEKPFQYWVDSGGWGKVLIHWKAHPIYGKNPNFLQEVHEKQKLDWDVIDREYNLAFIDSAVNVFNAELIRKGAIGKNESSPDSDADYYAGIDTSTTGNDYCTMPILKHKNGKYSLVYLYRKRQQTSEYHMYQMGEILRVFKPKKIGIEVTGGTGQVYLEQLSRQFKNLHFEAIRTTGDSKPVMVSNLVLALEKEVIEYSSNSPLIDEMLSFRRDGKKLEASPGKHDDTVMGVCFALAVAPFSIRRKSLFDDELLSKMSIY